MSIQPMQPGDLHEVGLLAADLVALHHQWDETRFFTTDSVAQGYRDFFRRQLSDPKVLLLTARSESAVIGYLYGTVEPRDWAKLLDPHGAIHDLFVSPTARGQGTATSLMTEAIRFFRLKKLERVVLYSAAANSQAQALFGRLGFRPTMVEMTLDVE
jgi:ribosomal protein S18 acetylase RimI-like enzyme